jgi:hypothetical protein
LLLQGGFVGAGEREGGRERNRKGRKGWREGGRERNRGTEGEGMDGRREGGWVGEGMEKKGRQGGSMKDNMVIWFRHICRTCTCHRT